MSAVEVLSFIDFEEPYFKFGGSNLIELKEYLQNAAFQRGAVCFTGSRPANLPWKYNEECELCINFKQRLKELVRVLYDLGYRRFISGMALGFDTVASEVILELKNEGLKIYLECALACENQEFRWGNGQKQRFKEIIEKADRVTNVNKNYFNGCFIKRNQYMIDNSSVVVSAHFNNSIGTASTLSYAKKRNIKIINIT